nr:S9 family peptidase [Xanthomonas albilineans]
MKSKRESMKTAAAARWLQQAWRSPQAVAMGVRGCLMLLLTAIPLWALAASAPSEADYRNAQSLRARYAALVDQQPSNPVWVDGEHFLYRIGRMRAGKAPRQDYLLVDVRSGEQHPLFDPQRLADALTHGGDGTVAADDLQLREVSMHADGMLSFARGTATHWRCDLHAYRCERRRDSVAGAEDSYDLNPPRQEGPEHAQLSPDGRQRAWVEQGNLVVERTDGSGKVQLSRDGGKDDYYAADSIAWSPDSSRLVAWRVTPAPPHVVYYIESAPADQLQPKLHQQVYAKPGDPLAVIRPVLFDVASQRAIQIDNALFPNPFELGPPRWRDDGRSFTFEYNQRGHQLYRVIEADGRSGHTRTLIEETSPTFIEYSDLSGDHINGGKHFRQDLDDGKQLLWASERDGWEHLYLYDGKSGRVVRQVTRGPWVVRKVDRVDQTTRQVWFTAAGMNPGEDPYYRHAYRIGLDGGEPVALTPEASDHQVFPSPDGHWLLDLYSRVDQAPVLVLRRGEDGTVVRTIAHADISRLLAAGWQPPLPFHAPGRDGHTEIWGVIHRPQTLDPAHKYPVVEDIYAGPQGSFVPKTFTTRVPALTGLGFAVAQIDGMGTNNRSRAFHDVAWHNLKDGGFPDRILWHQAAAARYPWYAIEGGIGVFGTSAGGQNALGALLFHPEFYRVGVANSGSHDNRMDKIWWNEQWMGWPIGPWYAASSNVDNAWRLQGHLLLVTGDMDQNVDPASTFQVVDRLIKAGKEFDLLLVPGGDHGAGGAYGERRLLDFFVRWMQHAPTPDWNRSPTTQRAGHP